MSSYILSFVLIQNPRKHPIKLVLMIKYVFGHIYCKPSIQKELFDIWNSWFQNLNQCLSRALLTYSVTKQLSFLPIINSRFVYLLFSTVNVFIRCEYIDSNLGNTSFFNVQYCLITLLTPCITVSACILHFSAGEYLEFTEKP